MRASKLHGAEHTTPYSLATGLTVGRRVSGAVEVFLHKTMPPDYPPMRTWFGLTICVES